MRPRPTATSDARASPGRRPTAPTISGGPSSSGEPAVAGIARPSEPPEHLTGPVDVCVDVPRLALDRAFTYLLPEDGGAGTGSLVSVPFHGRTVRGWVLGPAREAPAGRILPVRTVRSPIRYFDQGMLRLLRWTSERYLAPLATVIERSHPPRVAAEEAKPLAEASAPGAPELAGGAGTALEGVLARYRGASVLEPGTTTWLRPLPDEEATACVAAVARTLAAARTAIVLVPEAEPVPHTAASVLAAFGERAVSFLGGDQRARYRTWLGVRRGAYDVVVATRPGVFAPLPNLGLVWVSREVHPGHREDRSPYYHVREVAMARARLHGAACVLASFAPSTDVASAIREGAIGAARAPRAAERAAAPLVETAPPEAEDRSARLGALLRTARSGALILSRRGAGLARVCRSCGEPAACARCGGPITVEGSAPACRACGAPGRCANCDGTSFKVERGGTERVAEWASTHTRLAVDLERQGEASPVPAAGRLLVGTAAAVKDVGPANLDVVGILDPDRALSRPGVHAGEQALATWMEAAAWAASRSASPPGRVLAQTRRPGHPALQALIRWNPEPYLALEAERRAAAGFPPNHPVFRIEGTSELPAAVEAMGPVSMLATAAGDRTVCLVAVRPERLPAFREAVLRLAAAGTVDRVEAEPQL